MEGLIDCSQRRFDRLFHRSWINCLYKASTGGGGGNKSHLSQRVSLKNPEFSPNPENI